MQAKVLAPRRILIAVVLAFAFGSVGVLAAGASGGGPTGEVPATWQVPAPRQGDAGEYQTFVLDKSGAQVGDLLPYLAFDQVNASTELDIDGRPVLVDPLRVREAGPTADFNGGDPRLVWGYGAGWILPFTKDASVPYLDLGIDAGGNVTGGAEVLDLPVPVVQQRLDVNVSVFMRMYPEDAGVPLDWFLDTIPGCGLRNAMQGQAVDVRGSVRFLAPCSITLGREAFFASGTPEEGLDPSKLRFVQLDGNTVFHALGTQELGGHDTLVLEREGGARLRIWMARDVPYPIQLSLDDEDGVHVIRLTSFKPGHAPLATGAPARGPAPAVEFAGTRAWGLDDAGTGLEVPPSMAWQAALDDGPLADFLDQHPLAFTYGLAGSRQVDPQDSSIDQTWWFDVGQDGTAIHVGVHAHVPTLVAQPALPGLPPLVAPVRGDPEYTFEYPAGDEDVPVPPLDATWLPATLPTARSMLARMQAYTDGALEPTWTLTTQCIATAEDEGSWVPTDVGEEAEAEEPACVEWAFLIGTEQSSSEQGQPALDTSSQPPAIVYEGSTTYHTSSWRTDGRIVWTVGLHSAQDSRLASPQVLGAAARDPYVAPPALDDWDFPSGAAVVGIGALAALVGVLYLLWPLAKGGVMGLYARVTGNEVLEHPQRQRILAAVEATPGIHLKQIARETGLAWGQTQHHVGKLVQAGALVAKPTSGYTCYFPKGQDRHVMGAAHVLKADGARRLLQQVATTTGMSIGQLARGVGLTESTAHYHLKKMEAAGLVSTMLVDGARHVTLTPLGAEAGRRYGGAAAVAAS